MKERGFAIDAKIVYIMKSRVDIGPGDHNTIMNEVPQMITLFKPTPKQIRKRINGLIDTKYMYRDKANKKLYHYIPA